MGTNYGPTADMLLVSHDAKKLRNNLTKFLPNIGLSMVNYGRCYDIDRFYNRCQQHRDWYKDFSGKIKKVEDFNFQHKKYESRPSPTSVYVNQPLSYMTEFRPVTYPNTIERKGRPKDDGTEINLSGTFNPLTCTKYKR